MFINFACYPSSAKAKSFRIYAENFQRQVSSVIFSLPFDAFLDDQ